MIPLRDTIPVRRTPIVNYALIGLNVAVFAFQLSLGDAGDLAFAEQYGVIPRRFFAWLLGEGPHAADALIPFVSYMFLHGGFLHILLNVMFLWIFGDNIEDAFGRLKYLAFYLLCGVGSALVHAVLGWRSELPTIGASGAIAGVMGAYMILYPQARVVTLVPILIWARVMEIPAYVLMGLWLLQQFLGAGGAMDSGVAWWAHIGGFFVGILLLSAMRRWDKVGKKPPLRVIPVGGNGRRGKSNGKKNMDETPDRWLN